MAKVPARVAGRRSVPGVLVRLVPPGAFAALGAGAVASEAELLALLAGAGFAATGGWFFRWVRRGDSRRQLSQAARENTRELGRVAREDRVAAPQMKRLVDLQAGLLESWELLPAEYGELLEEDLHTIVGEVRDAARLARRRGALRRHLEGVDRRKISRRIKGLERDLADLEPDSRMRAPFESALAGRRGELEGYDELLEDISVINAQLESAESTLGGLRGELLALDGSAAPPRALESDLARLKERVAYLRRSMDEVARSLGPLDETITEQVR